MTKPVKITELVLRDAHQSLLATRLRIEDMLPVARELDEAGYWSLEVWGGATFDACIRFLGEDPWERLRTLKEAMPKTPLQMLLRGQNLLGYRHYADDVVEKFVERAAANGMDVFRIFDALNDMDNLKTAVKATLAVGKHAQGTLSYTTSPVHTTDMWIDYAKQIEDLGCTSICIKDMAGLLKPYVAEELVGRIKEVTDLPISLHSHATTGLSTVTLLKAVEAGVDVIDCAISSMSQLTGHTATETMVATYQDTPRETGFDLANLEKIAMHFRQVRKKYARFEGTLKGVDGRILTAQVPGGMLSNLENQLREQGALDRLDQVLEEIPTVRKDLGYIPLVTPTSQIVGSQAVINVLLGTPYKSITRETEGILKGEYGRTPAPVNPDLQAQVLKGDKPVTGRPADQLEPELERLDGELLAAASEKGIELAKDRVDDVLTYALFPQVGLKFLQHRGDPSAFEPAPTEEDAAPKAAPAAKAAAPAAAPAAVETYRVTVMGQTYDVEVATGSGAITDVAPAAAPAPAAPAAGGAGGGREVAAPLSGTVARALVRPGETVREGQPVIVIEAMKMETEVPAPVGGTVGQILVQDGERVENGQALVTIAEESGRAAAV